MTRPSLPAYPPPPFPGRYRSLAVRPGPIPLLRGPRMDRRFRGCRGLVLTLALVAPGCLSAPLPRDAGMVGEAPARVGAFGGTPARPAAFTLPMEVLFVRCADDAGAAVETLWREVDEQVIDDTVRRRLAANGLRAGILRGDLPATVLADTAPPLSAADDSTPSVATATADAAPPVVRQVLRLLPGRENEVVSLRSVPNLVVMERDDDGLHGASYSDALPHFSVRAWPGADGRVRVELVPVIRHGPVERSWVGEEGVFTVEAGQRRQLLESLRCTAEVPADAMLVVGAAGDAGATVGDALFRPRGAGPKEWRLLAMRPIDPAVDPMFRPGDAPATTGVAAAPRAADAAAAAPR